MTPGIGTARHCHGPAWRSRQSKAAPATGRRLWPERSDRSRPLTAKADIALVCRDLGWALKPLDAAYKDHANAAHARHLKARYLLLIGRLDEAERLLAAFDPTPLLTASRASFELVNAGIAMRRLRIKVARAALEGASAIARQTCIASLAAEVESAAQILDVPAARMIVRGKEKSLRLDDIETLLASKALVIDACRHVIARSGQLIPLNTRPVLFALARTLAEASPGDASRPTLLSRAFGAKHVDESHRVRLRVEIGRLRKCQHRRDQRRLCAPPAPRA
jgi:hypothetical protein